MQAPQTMHLFIFVYEYIGVAACIQIRHIISALKIKTSSEKGQT